MWAWGKRVRSKGPRLAVAALQREGVERIGGVIRPEGNLGVVPVDSDGEIQGNHIEIQEDGGHPSVVVGLDVGSSDDLGLSEDVPLKRPCGGDQQKEEEEFHFHLNLDQPQFIRIIAGRFRIDQQKSSAACLPGGRESSIVVICAAALRVRAGFSDDDKG